MKICSIDGCSGKHIAKGYCKKHYERLQRNNDPLYVKNYPKTCSVEDCKVKVMGLGYCQKHYVRNWKYGDPLYVMVNMNPPEFCTIDGCNNKHCSKGYCSKHYLKWRKYGDPLASMEKMIKKSPNICVKSECKRKSVAKGYCDKHYRAEYGRAKGYRDRKKRKIIGHYSNNKFECEWCKVKDMRVLSIDHINGGGNRHRKNEGKNGNFDFYGWLVKNNFPEGFRVLCMNCQWIAKHDKHDNGKWINENK